MVSVESYISVKFIKNNTTFTENEPAGSELSETALER
jgi:hypothetical protein